MDNIERIAIYKGIKYYRLDDATAAIGLMGRTYNFNMAIEQVGAKIVKVPGFGNSYFLSENDLLNIEQQIKNNANGLGGERVDAGTGQVVTKVQPFDNQQNSQATAVSSQKMGVTMAANVNPNSSNGTANQKLNPNQTNTLPEQQGTNASQNVANEAIKNSNPKGASGNGLASNNQNSSSNS